MNSPTQSPPLAPQRPLRYVIADQHRIVSDGVIALLAECPDLRCVGQVTSGRYLMEILYQNKPDILLSGLFLDHISSLSVFRQCRKDMPQMGIIVLSMSDQSLAVSESARAGAHAFISKNEDYRNLIETIFRVARGERGLFPKGMNSQQLHLPEVEKVILRSIAKGMTQDEIAREINRSSKTVEMYRARLMRRLGAHKSTELVRIALESGIILNDCEENFLL